jgi:hypothetical protein
MQCALRAAGCAPTEHRDVAQPAGCGLPGHLRCAAAAMLLLPATSRRRERPALPATTIIPLVSQQRFHRARSGAGSERAASAITASPTHLASNSSRPPHETASCEHPGELRNKHEQLRNECGARSATALAAWDTQPCASGGAFWRASLAVKPQLSQQQRRHTFTVWWFSGAVTQRARKRRHQHHHTNSTRTPCELLLPARSSRQLDHASRRLPPATAASAATTPTAAAPNLPL